MYKDQPYFPPRWEGAFPDNMIQVWDRHFGFVQQSTGRAMVVGEFGGFYTGDDKRWQGAVVDYFVEREPASQSSTGTSRPGHQAPSPALTRELALQKRRF